MTNPATARMSMRCPPTATLCYRGIHAVTEPGTRKSDGSCLECSREYQRNWQRANAVRVREMLNAVQLERGCAHCGYAENSYALQWDHIVPVVHGRRWTGPKNFSEARALLADPNIQVLCANCHCIKTRTAGDYLPLSRRCSP